MTMDMNQINLLKNNNKKKNNMETLYLHILCLRAMYLMIALLCTIFLSPSTK